MSSSWILEKALKLKPCPFCGCDERNLFSTHDGHYGHFVECRTCLARVKEFGSLEEAIDAWNTRSGERNMEYFGNLDEPCVKLFKE